MTALCAPQDPLHVRPSKPTADELRHDVESVYGRLVHQEHVATDLRSQAAYRSAAAIVESLLWPVTA